MQTLMDGRQRRICLSPTPVSLDQSLESRGATKDNGTGFAEEWQQATNLSLCLPDLENEGATS
jgi:hypothetical protein